MSLILVTLGDRTVCGNGNNCLCLTRVWKKRIQATRSWDKGQLGRQDLEPKRKKWQFKIQIHQAFPGGSDGKESVCYVADRSLMIPGSSLEGPLEKGMATHSSILAWRIPWTEEPGRLQSMRSQRVGHDWATNTHKQ